jgi:pseudouridine-5'-phosphate glycosidase
MLITVPVPVEDELPHDIAEAAIHQATREAEAEGVHGAAVTPFVLARVAALTEGVSRRANTALLIYNAQVAGAIAAAYVKL